MELFALSISIVAFVFSTIAAVFSVICFIKLKAAELSKYEFITADTKELFETDVDKINKELDEDEVEDEIDAAFDGKSRQKLNINKVII